MTILNTILSALLDRLGRHATLFLAGGAAFGLCLPQLSAVARPLLAPLVVVLLALALMRAPWNALWAQARRPTAPMLGVAWLLLASGPLMAGGLALVGPLESPGVQTAMVLMAAASPIVSAPAIAMMMGLPLAPCLTVTLLATIAAPLSVPWIGSSLLHLPVEIDAGALAIRMTGIVTGGLMLAGLARWWTTADWRARHARRLDGVAVILLFVFALAIMEEVSRTLLDDPARVARLIGLSFVLCVAMMVMTTLVFLPFGRATALGLGYIASSRNMGLLLAGLPAGADPGIGLWFAVAQFPLYMLPALTRPVMARLTRPRAGPTA